MNAVKELIWNDEAGIGFFPADPAGVYNDFYFKKYVGYSQTDMGRAITAGRILFVADHLGGKGDLVDVGIGCGHFVEERNKACTGRTSGYDVNPAGVKWLRSRGLWRNPYRDRTRAVSMFDALEHMEHPDHLVSLVDEWIFLSIPIFKGKEHALASRHFRPMEHFHYFTRDGLIRFMLDLGFKLKAESRFEIDLGREDIETFAFKRE